MHVQNECTMSTLVANKNEHQQQNIILPRNFFLFINFNYSTYHNCKDKLNWKNIIEIMSQNIYYLI